MIVLFSDPSGDGKTTVLPTFSRYLLKETRLRVCTIDLDYRTAKLTKILTPNVEVLCDLYDVAEDLCSNVIHVVPSDRHVYMPAGTSTIARVQSSSILDLLQELNAVLDVDLALANSVEPVLITIADRRIFKIIRVIRSDIADTTTM